MSVFRFKYFNVVNERSAMKVNTDGVLLGAAMTILPADRRLLDIGTGTGTIALMAAQRALGIPGQAGDDEVRAVVDVVIDAIDIDEPSASEAAANFGESHWAEHLRAHNLSLQDFADSEPGKYDLIFSNPPYFEDSCIAPDERKSTARHTSVGLSYRDIFEFALERLTENGRVSLVLPADQEAALCRYARMCGLHLFRIMCIRTVERKAPIRIITEFSRQRCQTPAEELLTIMNEGKYTQEYLSLTKDFYLFA
ncbi:MAG: methyltransferase [Bacteroidales bacterium]|nr:methyltransferase [Bacteroidales bacterium]